MWFVTCSNGGSAQCECYNDAKSVAYALYREGRIVNIYSNTAGNLTLVWWMT